MAANHSWDRVLHDVVGRIVRDNLVGVTTDVDCVERDGTPGLALSCRFGALLQAIYWQLAEIVSANAPLGRCEECRRWFVRSSYHQRFCASNRVALDGAPQPQTSAESQCAQRSRRRRYREQLGMQDSR